MRRSWFRAAEAAIGWIESAEALDRAAQALGNAIARPMQIVGRPSQVLRNAAHGTWYGHPVHPMLVTIPIGTWTLALALDVIGALSGARQRNTAGAVADTALKTGVAGAVGAVIAGLSDWQYTDGRDRRIGLVHAMINSTALALNVASVVLRARGHRSGGRAASAAGWMCMFAGGYLGGHLVYRRRLGVDHADRSPEPREFQPVVALDELQEDRPLRVEIRDEHARQSVAVVLVRHNGRVHAMGARCSHLGGPLDEGWILGGTLVCPWHGTRYDLKSGLPTDGPSTCAQPRYLVRLREGRIEIKREQEPGDEIVTRESIDCATAQPVAGQDLASGKKADEVLIEHHQFLRLLFGKIEATPASDPQRRDLMRTLASELEIHEHLEDKIFYPAVRRVSEDVAIAHSEHRELSDLLAMTLKLNTASPEFEDHFRALHVALEHHAGSEERSMFKHAQRLGEARLRALGRALEAMLEQQRTSRFQCAFRDLKISLLEAV